MGKVCARLIISFVWVFGAVSCSTVQQQVSPDKAMTTDSGFRFRFAMEGEWYPSETPPGVYLVAQKPAADGMTKAVFVRHGPIHVPPGKKVTSKEIFDCFKRDLENDSQGGRASNVKTRTGMRKHDGAECMVFEQMGQDTGAQGGMNMNNDGIVCLHPRKQHRYIWMAVSERWPLGKLVSPGFADDKKRLFSSLKFVD